jgi:hypothetical protein
VITRGRPDDGADAEGSRETTFSAAWLALLPAVYLIHLLDERLSGIGTAEFATRYLEIRFTNSAWLAVNAPSFLAFAASALLVARHRWPDWVAVALATHLALHGLGRVPTSAWFATLAPGVVSGLAVCLPSGVATLLRGHRALTRAQFRIGVLVGLASFQPFWHFLALPFLTSPPP